MSLGKIDLADCKQVLVTGGAGFIGSHLIRALISHKHIERIAALDNLSVEQIDNIPVHSKVQFIKGDLRQKSQLLEATANVDIIFHLAAQTSVLQSIEEPESYFDNNALGTLQLFEAARSNRVKRMVIASTCAVYGEQGKTPVTEIQTAEALFTLCRQQAGSRGDSRSFL